MNYEPEHYWEDRYSRLDLTRSGHRDLPEAYNRWLYRRKQAALRRGLARIGFSPRGKQILEIGAGIGAYVDFWKGQEVGHLTGLDLSSSATAFLLQQYPEFAFFKRDVTAPGLAADLQQDDGEAGFDLVTALDVLYHVVDDALLEAALRNIADVLRPGGVFALHDQFLHRPTEHHGYIRWRSLAHWQDVLEATGFDIVFRAPIFFVMIQPNDCTSRLSGALMDALWGRVSFCIQHLPRLTGALGYALDTTLGAFLREGPSMELMLVRRI